ncbi:MAG: HAMP domain-containing protein [Bradymonadales bacterium]|nr:HAMP domain-containing protein [Bradymonadales bacterium]
MKGKILLRACSTWPNLVAKRWRRRSLGARLFHSSALCIVALAASAVFIAFLLRSRTAAGSFLPWFAGIMVLLSLVVLLLGYLHARRLVRPLREMAVGMTRVAEGDLSYKVRTASENELWRISSAFNAMVKAVKERDLRLSEITEERLTRMEKQVSIGRLAAGVAHEINNPLTAVLSLSSLLHKHAPPDSPEREDLEMIVTETTRCRTIVRSLLEYAREHPTRMCILDINDLLRETLVLCGNYRALAQKGTSLQFSNSPLQVLGDWHALQQVFINLLINAGEATGSGQTISIESDEDSSGGFVVVKVKDTGKGIPKENLKRIFEPFFTTKGTGRGTGLGLSVSFGIIQKHNGFIEIESEVDQGTTVSVTLPRAREDAVLEELSKARQAEEGALAAEAKTERNTRAR